MVEAQRWMKRQKLAMRLGARRVRGVDNVPWPCTDSCVCVWSGGKEMVCDGEKTKAEGGAAAHSWKSCDIEDDVGVWGG